MKQSNGAPNGSTPTPHEHVDELENVPLFTLITTYISFAILVFLGHLRDFVGKIFKPDNYKHLVHQNVHLLFIG
jgi:serine palmitoyltransferase